jgi:hypothetical protein
LTDVVEVDLPMSTRSIWGQWKEGGGGNGIEVEIEVE